MAIANTDKLMAHRPLVAPGTPRRRSTRARCPGWSRTGRIQARRLAFSASMRSSMLATSPTLSRQNLALEAG